MIRAYDGATPTAFEAAGCFCLFDDEVLLMQRQRLKPFALHWGIPTGKIEGQETPSQCMARELDEELSLCAPAETLIQIADSLVESTATTFRYVSFALILASRPTLVPKTDEVRRLQWCSVDRVLKRKTVPFFYNTIQDLQEWRRSGMNRARQEPRPEARSARDLQPSIPS